MCVSCGTLQHQRRTKLKCTNHPPASTMCSSAICTVCLKYHFNNFGGLRVLFSLPPKCFFARFLLPKQPSTNPATMHSSRAVHTAAPVRQYVHAVCCCTYSIGISMFFTIPRYNGDRASPSPGAPFHASRSPSVGCGARSFAKDTENGRRGSGGARGRCFGEHKPR